MDGVICESREQNGKIYFERVGTILVSTGIKAKQVKHVVGAQHLKQDNAK